MMHTPLITLALLLTAGSAAAQGTAEVNPYGLASLWAQGDAVAKITLLILVLISLASWYVALLKLHEQRQLSRQLQQAQEGFWQAASVAEGLQRIRERLVENGADPKTVALVDGIARRAVGRRGPADRASHR